MRPAPYTLVNQKGVKLRMISRAVFDVEVVRDFDNRAELLGDCGGSPLPKFNVIIPNGKAVLRKGTSKVRVSLNNNDASECIDNVISVGVKTAQTLGLINKRRYNLLFDPVSRSISFFAKPVSRTTISTRIGSTVVENPDGETTVTHITDNEIFVSAIGIVALGIIKNQLLLKRGLVTKRVQLRAGREIFVEPFIQVTPNTAKKFGLFEGNTPVEFNQISSVLRIHPGK